MFSNYHSLGKIERFDTEALELCLCSRAAKPGLALIDYLPSGSALWLLHTVCHWGSSAQVSSSLCVFGLPSRAQKLHGMLLLYHVTYRSFP